MQQTQKESEETTMKKTIHVEGMMCMHCVGHVEKALRAVPSVKGVTVSLDDKKAIVYVDESVSNDALAAAIKDAAKRKFSKKIPVHLWKVYRNQNYQNQSFPL